MLSVRAASPPVPNSRISLEYVQEDHGVVKIAGALGLDQCLNPDDLSDYVDCLTPCIAIVLIGD